MAAHLVVIPIEAANFIYPRRNYFNSNKTIQLAAIAGQEGRLAPAS
jgi:hypothetical protein